MEWASSMAPPRCSPVPGSAVKSGNVERARLILTTPLREFHRSMLPTKSSGNSSRPSCFRKVILERLAALEHHAHYATVLLQDTLDRRIRPHLCAELLRRTLESVADCSH